MNYVNNKFSVIVFAILVASNSCSKSTKPTEVNPDVSEMTQGGFPVRLSVVRDGRSSCIGFRTMPDEPLVELFLVRRQRPDEGGDVYLNESWNVPGSTPLSPKKALDYFFSSGGFV